MISVCFRLLVSWKSFTFIGWFACHFDNVGNFYTIVTKNLAYFGTNTFKRCCCQVIIVYQLFSRFFFHIWKFFKQFGSVCIFIIIINMIINLFKYVMCRLFFFLAIFLFVHVYFEKNVNSRMRVKIPQNNLFKIVGSKVFTFFDQFLYKTATVQNFSKTRWKKTKTPS